MTARFELDLRSASVPVDGPFRPAWIRANGTADRPYGLIEATILRDDAPDAGRARHASAGLA